MRYSHEELSEHPGLLTAVRDLARMLRGTFNENPRLGRLLSAHQKWLLSQIAMGLSFEAGAKGFTANEVREFVTPTGIASHNTVQNYLDQLELYRYMEQVTWPSALRPRRYRAAVVSENALYRWFTANMVALDGLDGGSRARKLQSSPGMFRVAQPMAARACVADRNWVEPPERVGLFLWTEAGGMVMDDFICRIEDANPSTERVDIGFVDCKALAGEFMMSRTHLQRMLNKAAEQGIIGWMDDTPKSSMWLCTKFLKEYCGWQARKFCHVNDAFLQVLEEASESPVERNVRSGI